MPEIEETKFECRVCGYNSYRTVYDFTNITDGGPIKLIVKYHTCDGCSVMFQNPNQFTKNPTEPPIGKAYSVKFKT